MKTAKIETYTPELDDVRNVLDSGLRDTFTNVSVSVLDCPNLTQSPFHMSCQGLCGNPRLVDVGGPPYLLPVIQNDKIYHHKKVAELAELPNAFMIGAGAGPAHVVGTNCELMTNVKYEEDGRVINNTYIARVDVKAPYSETPLLYKEEVRKWVKYFTLQAPIVCVGCLITSDPGYDLWPEHFHGYSLQRGEGAHYDGDVTPDDVEYRGYFTIAESLYRLDQPDVYHWKEGIGETTPFPYSNEMLQS